MAIGIACSAGSYKGVFVHGVLAALSEAHLKADIYAASSSTAAVAAFAAIGELEAANGPEHWKQSYSRYLNANHDVSRSILEALPLYTGALRASLFRPDMPRFAVAVSAVVTKEGAELTQGPSARRLGQQLVLATRTKDRSWADVHLEARLFQTGSAEAKYRITEENLDQVLYATTRMLHAWKTPAWIDRQPYIDASYTCVCPAVELAQMGCATVIAISPESGPLYRDFFESSEVPSKYGDSTIHLIKPDRNLADIGVDYMKVTNEGLEEAYYWGREAGRAFLGLKRL